MANLRVNKIAASGQITENTGSVFFDGTGDSLQISSSNDFALGDTWTVETWVYFNEVGGGSDRNIILQIGTDLNSSGLGIYTENGPIIRVRANGTGSDVDSSTGDVTSNVWYHIAVSCVNNVASIYVDGILKGSGNTNGS